MANRNRNGNSKPRDRLMLINSLYFTMDVRVLDTSDFLAIANHFNYTCLTMFLKFELCVVFPSVSAFVLIQENNTTARVAF